MESPPLYDNKLISSIKSLFFHDSNQKNIFYKKFTDTYNLDFFKKKFEQNNLVIFSPNELKFNNLVPFKTTVLEFIKIYGKPSFSDLSQSNPNLKSLVYKSKISGIGSRCNLIFYKNKLVMFNYVFTEFTKQEKIILLDYSSEKFGNKQDNNNYKIMDSAKNSLFIKNSKNALVFSFYAPANALKETFDCKPIDRKIISFKEVLKAKKSSRNLEG